MIKNKKAKKHGITNLTSQPINPIDALVRKLDLVSCEMETIWGAGVLHSLCTSETSAKFMVVKNRLDQSIKENDYDTVKRDSEILMRGWNKMEAEAREAGHKPHGVDSVWYVSSQNGLEYIVCKHELDSARLVAAYPKKASSVYTLADIAKMIERESLPNNLSGDKDTFIKNMIEKKDLGFYKVPNDEIPF
jgi:hypothetical protein